MHDGSEKTLEQVVEFYNKGGIKNPALDAEMKPLNLTDAEKADLVAFMKALTGEAVAVALPTLPARPRRQDPQPRPTPSARRPRRPPSTSASVHRAVTAR